MQQRNPPIVDFMLGDDELSEPFSCWTDGSFGLTRHGGLVYAVTPVNDEAADQWVWAGPSVDDLVPLTPMSGLSSRAHKLRGHTYDAGWWPYSLWIDSDGTWHSLMHAEDFHQADGQPGWGSDLRTIGLWNSADQGATWRYQGVAVSIDRRFEIPTHRQRDWPRNGGCGDHKLVIDPEREFAYVLYTNFTYTEPDGRDTATGHLGIARAPMSQADQPAAWKKWHDGSFSEPADGGRETWIMSPTLGDADNSQRAVTWNTHLNCYVMVFVSRTAEAHLTTSHDLVHWAPSRLLYRDPHGINYVNLIATGPCGTDQICGPEMWLYYTRADYQVHRRLLMLDRAPEKIATTPIPKQAYRASSGFAERHGVDRWTYAYQARLNQGMSDHWSPMRWHASGHWQSIGGDARIGTDWQVAHGTECARVWRSPCTGRIRIHGSPSAASDGAGHVRLYLNRTRMWPIDRDWLPVRADVAAELHLEADVRSGDRIFFIVRGLDDSGVVRWDPVVEFLG